MAKFEITVSMGLVGCVRSKKFDVPDEDIEGIIGYERDRIIDDYAKDELWEMINYDVAEL
jgi:hypothetical protein